MKGDWQYIESESLSQTIAFDKNSGWLFCRDGTKYSPQELAKITQDWTCSIELPLSIHLVKKMFGGQIISIKRK